MRRIFKTLSISMVGVGSTYYVYKSIYSTNTIELTAKEVNQRQDINIISNSFHSIKNKKNNELCNVKVKLYRLKACPYCSLVATILDYSNIEYESVFIDPITRSGLPNTSYPYVPQLELINYDSNGDCSNAYIVDSEAIIEQLTLNMNINCEIKNQDDLTFIREVITKASFLSSCETFNTAYQSFPQLVPERYHWFIFRFIGTLTLSSISHYKLLPKLKKSDYMKNIIEQCIINDSSNKKNVEEILSNLTGKEALNFCTDYYIEHIMYPNNKYKKGNNIPQFNGGDKPDMIDIQLYALLRSSCQISVESFDVISNSNIWPWMKRMHGIIPGRITSNHIY